jgi:hypothetical protein
MHHMRRPSECLEVAASINVLKVDMSTVKRRLVATITQGQLTTEIWKDRPMLVSIVLMEQEAVVAAMMEVNSESC